MKTIHIPTVVLAGLLATSASPSAAQAEEAHRQMGAHVHGQGTLNIAVEGKKVTIELEAPGADIAGFEHEAATDADKATVAAAKAKLAAVLDIFKMPAGAACKVEAADVAIHTEEHHDDGDAEEAEEHHKEGEAHEEEHGAKHSEFHANYTLACAKPEQLTALEAVYFKTFGAAQKLEVNVVTEKGQNQFELTRDKPILDLTGIM